MNRRIERKHAFNLIFQLAFHDACFYDELLDIYTKRFLREIGDIGFIVSLYDGTKRNMIEIDGNITRFLTGWSIDRINRTDLALLRMATYELMFSDISERVVINEAVEMAKVFCDDESPKYINGVLGSIAKSVKGTGGDTETHG